MIVRGVGVAKSMRLCSCAFLLIVKAGKLCPRDRSQAQLTGATWRGDKRNPSRAGKQEEKVILDTISIFIIPKDSADTQKRAWTKEIEGRLVYSNNGNISTLHPTMDG